MNQSVLTPEFLLTAYQKGVFPIAESRDSETLSWCFPKKRGIIPLSRLQMPKDVELAFANNPFEITINTAFKEVLSQCAASADRQPGAWINPALEAMYNQLFDKGYAYSVECWKGNTLAGGLFGISIGAAFMGANMFSHERDAGNIALVALINRLREGGYQLFDTHYVNGHLKQFGAQEIPAALYVRLLRRALEGKAVLRVAVEEMA